MANNMCLEENEKNCLKDFLQYVESETLFQLAKYYTKDSLYLRSEQDAVNVILVHSMNLRTFLNKKAITRSLLFNYLHKHNISVTPNFTKATLIEQIITYWDGKKNSEYTNITKEHSNKKESFIKNFPIQAMSLQFAKWFCETYNNSKFKKEDFWNDSNLNIKIYSLDNLREEEISSSQMIVNAFNQIKNEYNFFLNPNLTPGGTEGKIDIHGLVLIISYGTLHIPNSCVGVYEAKFGLARNPLEEYNWKAKTIKLVFKDTHNTNPSVCGT